MTESPLVGRQSDLAVLRAALQATAEGAGGCVVVEGPSGMGKSRMLATVAAEALESEMIVASGRATELDRVAPLTTLMTSLQRSGTPGLQLGPLDVHEGNRYWLVNRLGELIEDYVRTRPLLVVLDDAQWADELTALALRVLIPALSSSPVLWLLARRLVPAHSLAQDAIELLIEDGAECVRLEPLDDDAVAEMCRNILRGPPHPSVLTLARRSGGNPFLLEQLLTTLRDEGGVVTGPDGTVSVVDRDLPSGFLTAVDQRLRALSPEARRLLEVGAVLGRPFTLHEAAGLVEPSAVELVGAADEAVGAGTLVERGPALAFCHDLIREAVYSGLCGAVRLALHREAAAVVQAEGRSPVEVAEHLVRSGRKGDEQALGVLREAATQVAASAPSTAADLILRMLQLMDTQHESRPHLIADAVHLLASAGRLVEAGELGETALHAGLDAPEEAALLLGLAEALKHAGQNTAVVAYTRRALSRPGVPDRARAQLLAVLAHGLLGVGEIEDAEHAGAEAAALAATSDVPAAWVFATVARSVAARTRGQLNVALALARRAVQAADRAGGEARHRHPRLWLARGLATLDRFDEADAMYAAGQSEADHLGTAWSQPLWHYYRAELRLFAGRLDDAQAEAEAGLRVAKQLGALQLGVPLLGVLAQVAIRRGEMSAAEGHCRDAEGLVAGGISVGAAELTWPRALLQLAGGHASAALDTLADAYDGFCSRLALVADDPSAAAVLVRLAQRCGAAAQAERAAEAARSLADRNPGVASFAGGAAHAEGLLHGDLDLLREAVAHYRASPRPLARAAALEDAARAEQAAGDAPEAVRLLSEALDHYTTSGARRDQARTQKALRTLGVRRRRGPHPGGGLASAWASLTESEMRVVRLVAEGFTNREVANQLFLSPHTVDSHLRHVFTKLDLNSRVQLTRLFATLEAPGDERELEPMALATSRG